MTATEALTALAPIVGSGGIVSVLIAWFGYKGQASKGRVDTSGVVASVSVGPPIAARDMELLANSASSLASAIMRNNLLAEYRIDRLGEHERFVEWVKQREMADVLAAFQAEQRERRDRKPT